MTSSVPFDPSALTVPVDRADVRAFTARLRRDGRLGTNVLAIGAIALLGVAVLVVAAPAIIGAFAALVRGGGDGLGVAPVVFAIAIVGVVVLGIVLVRRLLAAAGERRYRLDRFARENGMTWEPRIDAPSLPGMIFAQGRSRSTTDAVRGERPRFVEVGNYRYKTGSGKSEQTHRWGYVAIRLDVPLPHIVLDATGNNGLLGGSNLPTTFDRDQRLSLEGDFDRYFALYCPTGYERDALYLFTPDVMARFIDNAAALDVEIVDDWLFLYAKRDLSTLDPATWSWLFTTVGAILDKLAQWSRWRDERLNAAPTADAVASGIPGATAETPPLLTPPPAGVAREGRRLRRGFSWVTGALVVLGIGWWVLTIVFDVITR